MAFWTPTSVVFSTFFTICEYAFLAVLEPAAGGPDESVDTAFTTGGAFEADVVGGVRTGCATGVGEAVRGVDSTGSACGGAATESSTSPRINAPDNRPMRTVTNQPKTPLHLARKIIR